MTGWRSPTGVLLLDQPPGERGGRGRLAVHDVDLGGRRAQGKGVVVVGRRAAHNVVGRGRAFSQNDQHHRHVGLLNGVDQRLTKAEQLGLFGRVADVNARSILEPADRGFCPGRTG